jgi:hypothetical protein
MVTLGYPWGSGGSDKPSGAVEKTAATVGVGGSSKPVTKTVMTSVTIPFVTPLEVSLVPQLEQPAPELVGRVQSDLQSLEVAANQALEVCRSLPPQVDPETHRVYLENYLRSQVALGRMREDAHSLLPNHFPRPSAEQKRHWLGVLQHYVTEVGPEALEVYGHVLNCGSLGWRERLLEQQLSYMVENSRMDPSMAMLRGEIWLTRHRLLEEKIQLLNQRPDLTPARRVELQQPFLQEQRQLGEKLAETGQLELKLQRCREKFAAAVQRELAAEDRLLRLPGYYPLELRQLIIQEYAEALKQQAAVLAETRRLLLPSETSDSTLPKPANIRLRLENAAALRRHWEELREQTGFSSHDPNLPMVGTLWEPALKLQSRYRNPGVVIPQDEPWEGKGDAGGNGGAG